MKKDIFCSPDWNDESIKTAIESFCTNYAKGMIVIELEPNVLQGTLRKDQIKDTCPHCGYETEESARFCTECGKAIDLDETQTYAQILKHLPPNMYTATFKIEMDPNRGKFIQIDYAEGDSNTREYIETFWDSLYEGLKGLLEQPLSGYK